MDDWKRKNTYENVFLYFPLFSSILAVRRKENGWYDEDHPLVFLFLGSSGIGNVYRLNIYNKQSEIFLFIGNMDIFPLIQPSDIVIINKQTGNYWSVWHETNSDVIDKNNNVSFEHLNKHFHQYCSLSCHTRCNTSDNVSRDL